MPAVIDFINAPMNPSMMNVDESHLSTPYSFLANPTSTQLSSQYVPSNQQAYIVPTGHTVAMAYPAYSTPYSTPSNHNPTLNSAYGGQYQYQNQYLSSPMETVSSSCLSEEALRQKINSKIDSIMESHKTEMLSSQVEKLSDRVHRLSRNLDRDTNTRARSESPRSISPVTRVSSSFEPDTDREIRRRLSSLAKETGRTASRMPDW
jgi:hypothetical protein